MENIVEVTVKDMVGSLVLLVSPVKVSDGQMYDLFEEWQTELISDYATKHPEKWDAEAESLLKDGARAEEVWKEIAGEELARTHHQSADLFVKWLVAKKGFKKKAHANIGIGIDVGKGNAWK